MSELTIAIKTGLLTNNVKNLLNGIADISTASKLGVFKNSLQEFLNGKANIAMASKLGLMTGDLQILLNKIGKDGAIGLVFGLLLNSDNN